MASEADGCFVWLWLEGASAPVVAGRIERSAGTASPLTFNYGRSYLERPDAIAIDPQALPLRAGRFEPTPPMVMPSAIRDGSPDAWGRRVIINRLTGGGGALDPGELTFLLESGSDRIGALDFQASATDYAAREHFNAPLAELQEAAARVEEGLPLTPALEMALRHGTSIGGARPKALIDGENRKWIAKFSASNDTSDVIRAEYIAMKLAAACGLDVAEVRLEQALGKTVLMVRRFDRVAAQDGAWQRRMVHSALTILELDEIEAPYASYADLADRIRQRFVEPKASLRELFGRLVFNILCGNTDDHARNHAAFWDGTAWALTPAYDLCPQSRTGQEAGQAMEIANGVRRAQLQACLDAAGKFLLSGDEAWAIADAYVATIARAWDSICDESGIAPVDRKGLWGRQFLNPFAFFGMERPIPNPAAP